MNGRNIFRPAAYLLIIAILGVSYSSAHAQTQTRHLVFSTYLGPKTPPTGPAHTFAQNCASDAQGNTYVTGATDVSNLPVSPNAFQQGPALNSTQSAFVAKYDPNGQPLWCTYLGGDNQSMGIGVAAMPNGGVVVVGLTTSDVSGPFPTKNAYQNQYHGNTDYFVTVFDANGNLTYSTYLGGSGVEGQSANQSTPFADDQNSGNCVAVDAQGLVYVAGMTSSSDFPVTPNHQQGVIGGGMDACLCIIDPSQSGASSLIYASFLGGGGDDQGHSVAVNASGSLIAVAGYTDSGYSGSSPLFPTTTNALAQKPASNFRSNGFVTQFSSSQPGSPTSTYNMLYSTYLGGTGTQDNPRDDTYGMTMDPSGRIVVTGRTEDQDFPMTASGPTIFNSTPSLTNDEPYVVKINPALNGPFSLVYSTFLGGAGGFCTSLAVDAQGTVYVAGESTAQGAPWAPGNLTSPANFPYTQNALIKALPTGSEHVIFMVIDPSGANLGYSTYLGGSGGDRAYGLAVDPTGNIILSGLTSSQDFPTKNPAQGTWPGGNQNAFVTKFSVNESMREWTRAYANLVKADDLGLLRQYRDKVLSKDPRGQVYKAQLYQNSGAALTVLMDHPELLLQAKNLIDANMGAVIQTLQGHRGTIYDSEAVLAFLQSFGEKSPPPLQAAVKGMQKELRQSHRQRKSFLGFRLH